MLGSVNAFILYWFSVAAAGEQPTGELWIFKNRAVHWKKQTNKQTKNKNPIRTEVMVKNDVC